MKKLILAVVSAVSLAGILALQGHTQDPNDVPAANVKKFMRAKLDHSKQVLEGLALEDFDQIAKHSQELSLLSLASNWHVLQTPKYVQQSADFRRTADTLTEEAKKRNLDGATLAYMEMTLKCIQCHKYVRSVQMARLDPRDLNTPAQKTSARLGLAEGR